MLTGQAKIDYQRAYMRRRRSNAGSNKPPESVRPEAVIPVRPETLPVRPAGLSESQWNYIKMKAVVE